MNNIKIKFNLFYGPPILSGILLVLSFPNIDLFPLAWFGLTPLLLFLYGKDKKTAIKAGLFFGIIYFFGTTYWIYHSIYHYSSIPFVPSIFLVFLLCLYLSLYPALFSVLYASYISKTGLPAMLVAPIFWTVIEFIRSYALTGFPWSSIGYSQYKFLPFIQIADLIGIYGISFLIMAVNGALADVFLFKKRRAVKPLYSAMPVIIGLFALSITLAATFSYGLYRLNQDREGADIKAAVIQGNIEQDLKWDASYQEEVMNIYKELSVKAASEGPDIIVWPETALPFVFGSDSNLTKDTIEFQKGLNSYLLFGSILAKEKDSSQKTTAYSNSAVLLDKDGNISYRYDKIHLVPFGEYVPIKKLLFFIDKLVVGVGDYMPGDGYKKAATPFGTFSTLICYEIIFPGLVRKFYDKGGDFIITITNDAWFGRTYGPYQHFSMAVFRAIENRKPVIRAANTGVSGYIDSNGRILSKTNLFERTILIYKIKGDKTLTPYTKYGDIFSYLCIISSLLLLAKKTNRR